MINMSIKTSTKKTQSNSPNQPTHLVDSHCHLHDRKFFTAKQAEEMLKRATYQNVRQIITIGTDPKDSFVARDFAKTHPNVFWSFGIHPSEADSIKDFNEVKTELGEEYKRSAAGVRSTPRETLETSSALASFSLPIAIGETGLDYHYTKDNRSAQIKLFNQMLELASDLQLPVIFHVREAFDDFFAVIANFPHLTGVVHSFSDSQKNLNRALKHDFYIGMNGMATYTTLPTPPLERTILETDAPFLTPAPNRGKINEPAYIKDIAQFLATKLGVSVEQIAAQTTKNVHQLFKLPNPLPEDPANF